MGIPTVTTDILSAIDGTLTDWESSGDDAYRWSPHPFPPLPPEQLNTVRQVAHDTGLDGYAAWLAVADVQIHGPASPYAEWVWPPIRKRLGVWRQESPAPIRVTVDTAPFTAAVQQAARVIERFTVTFRPVADACAYIIGGKVIVAGHSLMVATLAPDRRRKHYRRCGTCRPYSNPGPLCIDGREYHRRQKSRRR